ncbi:iron-sulfur cluster assembly accessory protein [Halalkalibacterium halodurans]|uniref:BH3410 protein n=2 Tax=Halalkalibacterium halodurans TaxID=86665 RepID=Q9K7F2_HALH5|nr:iron-sulfur cluster assembly accessory protein [Halalkalibacterium halodurans]MDY7223941.1 iron-sulfur cluster assembly accessory protein [Halalkalibacterium halodurans]MDY7243162.1 iron-sulfur cluster assembly accessory protein [Halalkalibacterium halodurans]MED3645261.1 iron-sulfur cluster assembly accessory protein [Halalkalibacterium halodurans]MED4083233.1 iron-sulfur cluster assembly accessory protein [Halalkalibacterium halodurans]MED4086760.1 iron-sulfur cluster assembly accessory p
MIKITDAAVNRIKEMMKEEGEEGLKLRVGVKGGGCSGLSYGMGFDNEQTEDDTLHEINGLSVLIDNESGPILKDVVIDYKQNMMGGGFTIDNPNAIATCGCGTSFRTATNAGTPEDC